MQRSIIALAAALALAGGSAMAQQKDQPGSTPSARDSQSSGGSFTERAKETMKKIGEKTREMAGKVKDKTEQTADRARQDSDEKSARSSDSSTRSMGASGSDTGDGARRQRMDQAYGDYQKKGQSSSSSSSSSTSR